jgi:hypothetical protein
MYKIFKTSTVKNGVKMGRNKNFVPGLSKFWRYFDSLYLLSGVSTILV